MPEAAAAWLDSGDTVVVLGDATGCLGLFRLGDELRPEAQPLIDALKATGRSIVLLTNDSPTVAQSSVRARH